MLQSSIKKVETPYFVSNADQSIIKPEGQILSVIGPATTGDSAVDLVFGHILLFWRPQSFKRHTMPYISLQKIQIQ